MDAGSSTLVASVTRRKIKQLLTLQIKQIKYTYYRLV